MHNENPDNTLFNVATADEKIGEYMQRYNFLQYKIMEAMGFGTDIPDTEWSEQRYSDTYRHLFNDLKENKPELIEKIPHNIIDARWSSPELQELIAFFVDKIKLGTPK